VTWCAWNALVSWPCFAPCLVLHCSAHWTTQDDKCCYWS